MTHSQNLTRNILLAMFAGVVLGSIFEWFSRSEILPHAYNQFINLYLTDGLFDIGGKLFIKALKLLVVPVVLISLICGVTALDDTSRLGKLSLKTIGLYLITTGLAISLALIVSLWFEPGIYAELKTETTFSPSPAPDFKTVILDIFPSNLFESLSSNNKILQIIVFALLFGFAINKSPTNVKQKLSTIFSDLNTVMMTLISLIMRIAPIGVFCLIIGLFADEGVWILGDLGRYFANVIIVLLLHFLLIYMGMLVLLARLNPLTFLKHFRPVLLFGFSTASSNATLPITLNVVEKKLGVNNKIAAFTLPLGATINMDGTAIMQGVATVFISQLYQIDLTLIDYLMVIMTATLASIGTAGVPGVGLITLATVLQQVGLPVEGIGLIIGIDRLLDMTRTAINITGDAVISCVVAKSEDQLDLDVYNLK